MAQVTAAAPFRDAWAKAQDGTSLHANVYGEAVSNRCPVVCLPGLARSAADFNAFALALRARRPNQIIAIDYRGRGRSGRNPDPSRYSVPVETEDLLTLLDSLAIERAVFVGSSRGGLITLSLATIKPAMIAGIVFNDIGPELQREGLLRIKGYVGRLGPAPPDHARGAESLRSLFERQFPALGEEDWRHWSEVTWVNGQDGLALDYDPALARNLDGIDADTSLPDLWPLFDALPHVPILAIRGEHSDLLSAETLVRMAAWRPSIATATVTGEGHTPLLHRPALVERISALVGESEGRPPQVASGATITG